MDKGKIPIYAFAIRPSYVKWVAKINRPVPIVNAEKITYNIHI